MKSINPITELKRRQGGRSMAEFAKEIGCSTAYLSDIYKEQRKPGPKILVYLGLTKKEEYGRTN
jgi:transcriptional regulator with XRE-family HTH domain